MLRRFSVNFAIFSMALDMGLTLLALMLAAVLRPLLHQLSFVKPLTGAKMPPALFIAVPILWGITFLVTSVYDPKRIYKAIDEFQLVTVATALATLIFAGLLYLTLRQFSRALFLLFILLDVSLLLSWRIIARIWFKMGNVSVAKQRVLIVGAGDVGQRVGGMLAEYQWMGLDLSGYLDDDPKNRANDLPILGQVADVRYVVEKQQIDDVVIALPQKAYGRINELVLALHDLPVNVRVVPDYFSLALYRASVEDFGGLPLISLRDPALNEVQRMVKRLFDLAIASITIFLLLPVLGIIALIIKLDSKGPIIFLQKRVGENGRLFNMFKFRSMVVGAENLQETVKIVDADGNAIYKKANDPRVTRFGRFIRRTSLDELPQLFNVLLGNMSLVGPRPELPMLVGKYDSWQHKRLAVPQGMTGWWQINGRSDKPLHLHTQEDIYYIQNYSLWMDIYILLKTPWVVVRGRGAY